MMEKILEIRIGKEDAGRPVREVLKRRAGLTRAQIRSVKFRPGGLSAEGRQVRSSDCLREGQVLRVLLEKQEDGGCVWTPNPGPLEILYEDEDLIAVEKPSGMVVHPSPGHYGDSLANRLADYFLRRNPESAFRIRAVGRLDKDTSGIMLFAKNQAAAAKMEGNRQKEYLAVTAGCPESLSGTVCAPLGKCRDHLMKMEVQEEGKRAVTHYEVARPGKFSLVRVWLETGRTHQIRVHMAYIGHPLAGDSLYGGDPVLGRAALHAWKLSFIQPFSGKKIELTSELPQDMKEILEK